MGRESGAGEWIWTEELSKGPQHRREQWSKQTVLKWRLSAGVQFQSGCSGWLSFLLQLTVKVFTLLAGSSYCIREEDRNDEFWSKKVRPSQTVELNYCNYSVSETLLRVLVFPCEKSFIVDFLGKYFPPGYTSPKWISIFFRFKKNKESDGASLKTCVKA